MENNPLIRLQGVSAGYEGRTVIHDVDLTVTERDFLGIIGPNGGGKTTLVKIILGLLKPQAGTVSFYRQGQPCRKVRMGYLPQQSSLDHKFPISVIETVLSGLLGTKRILRRYSREDRAEAMRLLQMLELGELAGRPVGDLSGGQRQRVLIGRALICHPEVLILDEPNTYIDQQNQDKLYRLLEQINHRCAVILVSHDIGTVLQEVRNIACVNHDVHYHAASEVDEHILTQAFGCPFELIAHGRLPHRILARHAEQP
jgi:zinc transport system ATP-binding protein